MGTNFILHMKLFIQDNLTQFLSCLPKIEAVSPLLCFDDDIVTLGEIGFVQSKEFPDEPLDSVPLRGVSCLFGYGYPQSRNIQPALFENQCKMGRMAFFA
jgi:hypothetical protein